MPNGADEAAREAVLAYAQKHGLRESRYADRIRLATFREAWSAGRDYERKRAALLEAALANRDEAISYTLRVIREQLGPTLASPWSNADEALWRATGDAPTYGIRHERKRAEALAAALEGLLLRWDGRIAGPGGVGPNPELSAASKALKAYRSGEGS